MGKLQRKKRNHKRFLSILLSAALIMQNGVPVLAEESTLMYEDEEAVKKTAVDGTEEESKGKSSKDETVQETEEDEGSVEKVTKDTAESQETASKENSLDASTESVGTDEAESGSGEERSTETATTDESSAKENITEQETATEETSVEEKEEEESSTEDISVGAGESTNAEGGNILKNGSFENVKSGADTAKWPDGNQPTEFGNIYESAKGTGMAFKVEDSTDAKDGSKVLHITSTDKTPRWDLAQSGLAIDPQKNYKCTF